MGRGQRAVPLKQTKIYYLLEERDKKKFLKIASNGSLYNHIEYFFLCVYVCLGSHVCLHVWWDSPKVSF